MDVLFPSVGTSKTSKRKTFKGNTASHTCYVLDELITNESHLKTKNIIRIGQMNPSTIMTGEKQILDNHSYTLTTFNQQKGISLISEYPIS